MTHLEALQVLAAHRGDRLVITTHGSVDLWLSLSNTSLDFSFVPTSMGQGPSLGLGIALAQPRRGVIVVTGDGALLMNLGCLVTIANHRTAFFLIIIDNGVYEVTGGQPVPGAGAVDFAALARAAGIERVYACQSAAEWRAVAPGALAGPGPVLVWLKVAARPGVKAPRAAPPMQQQLERLQVVLRSENPRETRSERE